MITQMAVVAIDQLILGRVGAFVADATGFCQDSWFVGEPREGGRLAGRLQARLFHRVLVELAAFALVDLCLCHDVWRASATTVRRVRPFVSLDQFIDEFLQTASRFLSPDLKEGNAFHQNRIELGIIGWDWWAHLVAFH